jgi:hypothetical protein
MLKTSVSAFLVKLKFFIVSLSPQKKYLFTAAITRFLCLMSVFLLHQQMGDVQYF